MLHLHARFEIILAHSAARGQLLMDSHEIPLAGAQKLEDLLPVRFGFLQPLNLRRVRGVRSQHFAYGRARQLQYTCNLVFGHSLRAQFQNRRSLRLAHHVALPVPFRFAPPSGRVPGAGPEGTPSIRPCACSCCRPSISGRASASRRLALRFQKQFRFGQDALANHARAVPPSGIELPGLPCVRTVLDESGDHPLAILYADARGALWARHQILHGQVGAKRSLAHLLLDRFRQ